MPLLELRAFFDMRPGSHFCMKNTVCPLLIAVLLFLFGSGCATRALWDGRMSKFHEPAIPSHLQLFEDAKREKVLVVYDDEIDSENRTRRAFWVDPKIQPPD